ADLEADHLVRVRRSRRQDDDRHARRRLLGADPAAHLEATEARQHQVEDDPGRTLALDEREAELAVSRLEHREALGFQIDADQLAAVALVVDHYRPAALAARGGGALSRSRHDARSLPGMIRSTSARTGAGCSFPSP